MTTQNLNTMSPREFDEELAAIYETHVGNLRRLEMATLDLRHTLKVSRYDKMRLAELKSEADARLSDETVPSWTRSDVRSALDTLNDSEEKVFETRQQIDVWDEAFEARGGWARFFLVTNRGGHIHSSMDCSTCRINTKFSWLPSVSGKTEKDAVAEYGPMLCSVCFPSAPVEWTNHWELEEERKKAESCPGSGTTDWVAGTTRFGYVSGNGGTCSHCNNWAGGTPSGRIRKHKPNK